MSKPNLEQFCEQYMTKGGRLVAGRLQAALALLERLRTHTSTRLDDHTTKGRASVISHETLAAQAMKRHALAAVNKNSGRRSSNLPDWGQPLLDLCRSLGFPKDPANSIDLLQREIASHLRKIFDEGAIEVQVHNRSAEAVIAEILDTADLRGRAGAVAQYLVGAKLKLRFPHIDIPIRQFNQRDTLQRPADYQISNAAIEVALGTPDPKHLDQIRSILDASPENEVWLLVRAQRLLSWSSEVSLAFASKSIRQRVVVNSVESFVGQNITELSNFSSSERTPTLKKLFDCYNTHWVKALGPASIRIEVEA